MGKPFSFTPQAGDSPKIKRRRAKIPRRSQLNSLPDKPRNRRERRIAAKLAKEPNGRP
jgi:hypothetical protein